MENKSSGNNSSPKSILVTIGEPAGIGPDIVIEAWSLRRLLNQPHFTVIGDVSALEERARLLDIHLPVRAVSNGQQAADCREVLGVIETKNLMKCTAGLAEDSNSPAITEAIEHGVGLVMNQEFNGLTTCPINKKALYDCGFAYPGHTEFLAALAEKISGKRSFPVMMLAGPQLRCVPVTIHMALSEVKNALGLDLIVETVRVAAKGMRENFGIENPAFAVAGVNPHAGESGTMGIEEIEFIAPAIRKLQEEGINAVGPLPADTMFHERARSKYDVAICMYHDQALIPAKTLGFDDAVNVTLGLPFIRTSPDHGTAYDLAGTGKAEPHSFVAALKMANAMAHTRKQII